MTKEEKIELVKKLDTQIDGVESYAAQLMGAMHDENDFNNLETYGLWHCMNEQVAGMKSLLLIIEKRIEREA